MLPYIIPEIAARQVIKFSTKIPIWSNVNVLIFNKFHKERDYNTLLPDYEEAIAQSMKQQPPPPYYQVAMQGSQMVPNNESIQSTATTNFIESVTPANREADHGIPPAYEVGETYLPMASASQTISTANEVDIPSQMSRQQ